MNGLMMAEQLTLDKLLRRAVSVYPHQEIVSLNADQSVHRYTFQAFYQRVVKLMNALRELGVKPGDRVATFAWNHHRHMEIYFAVPCLGAVLHTLNIRLSTSQLDFIVDHADDKVIFVDDSLVDTLRAVPKALDGPRRLVVMSDRAASSDPAPDGVLDYETLLDRSSEQEQFPDLSEDQAAALCYTSGTTGDPKGVLYSHRSTCLHAMSLCMVDTLGLSMTDAILPVVPMFHVNGWGIPFACCLTGAKLVLSGAEFVGRPLAELIQDEKITVAAGVPSVWYVFLRTLKSARFDTASLKRILVGGSAISQSVIRAYHECGVEVVHCWGMTEISPCGSFCRLKGSMSEWPEDQRLAQWGKQGLPSPLVDLKIVDDEGRTQPHDGDSIGEILVRGPWVVGSYYRQDDAQRAASFTDDGWLRTGDIASIDPHGYIEIVDRKKDLIKPRGEWVSSVEMENTVIGHEAVLEAAVVGRPDDVRGEAVVLFVVLAPDHQADVKPADINHYLRGSFQGWQLPRYEDIHFVDALPKTSVGKIDKKTLRARLTDPTS